MAEFFNEYGALLWEGTLETLYMTLFATLFAYVLGLPKMCIRDSHRPARWLSWAARSGCCSQAGRIFCRTRPGRQARGRYAASGAGGPCLPQKAKYGGRLRRRMPGG